MNDNFFQEVLNNITKIGTGEYFQETNKGQGVTKDISIFAMNNTSQLDTMNEICSFLSQNEDFGVLGDEKAKIEKELYNNLAYYEYGDFNILPNEDGNESWRFRGLS